MEKTQEKERKQLCFQKLNVLELIMIRGRDANEHDTIGEGETLPPDK
jgi:hypothetical protein